MNLDVYRGRKTTIQQQQFIFNAAGNSVLSVGWDSSHVTLRVTSEF